MPYHTDGLISDREDDGEYDQTWDECPRCGATDSKYCTCNSNLQERTAKLAKSRADFGMAGPEFDDDFNALLEMSDAEIAVTVAQIRMNDRISKSEAASDTPAITPQPDAERYAVLAGAGLTLPEARAFAPATLVEDELERALRWPAIRPCCMCGAAPCESPDACRSQARAENEPPDDYEETDCDG